MKRFRTYLLVTLLALLAAGQNAWAAATIKTVTYTITSIEEVNNSTVVTFTRYGDSFDTSQSTYTAYINNSALGNNGGTGHVSVQFADGFELNMSWNSGSNVGYTNNCIRPGNGKQITYSVSCKDDNYYVTHLKLEGLEGTLTDTDIAINQQWRFNYSVTDGHSLGSVTFTYTNAPSLSIFESPGVNNTYNIKSAADLRHLANYVNNGGNNCYGLTFLQTQDISYTHTTAWNDASSTEHNHTAIGTGDHVFCGIYDGQGHTISGIRIYSGVYQGLFGYTGAVGKGGTIKRVNLADARITGYSFVGGIAGHILQTTIEDCTVAANVCIHSVNTEYCHGGIVGRSEGFVQRCISRATLTTADSDCEFYGAIVGDAIVSGGVYDCIAIGATVPKVPKRGVVAGHKDNKSVLRCNYYRDCTVGGAGTNVGVGNDASSSYPHDVADNQGAQALFSITLPGNVTLERTLTATLPGTGNATYTTGADIDGTPYAFSGATVTLGANRPGYTLTYSVNGNPISGNTFTMPAADVTVTATWTANETLDITATRGTLNSVTIYWATFYHGSLNYQLPAGAAAYTMDSDYHLYRVGTDGSIIPSGNAVVIIAEASALKNVAAGSGTLTLTHTNTSAGINGTNILHGSDSSVGLDGDGKVPVPGTANKGFPYVLSLDGTTIGFRRYTGTDAIPANKAYYVQ